MSKNLQVEKQVENIKRIQGDTSMKKVNKISHIMSFAVILSISLFLILLILKLCSISSISWTIVFAPLAAFIVFFIIGLFSVGKTLMSNGMVDMNAIRKEEEKKINEKTKDKIDNIKKYQQIINDKKNKNKYSKYKNIK